MVNDNQVKIKLVIYKPDPGREKNYATVVLAGQKVKGEWYTQERIIPIDELPDFKEEFRWTGARHGFQWCGNPPLVPNIDT